jgi:hypothetical protein
MVLAGNKPNREIRNRIIVTPMQKHDSRHVYRSISTMLPPAESQCRLTAENGSVNQPPEQRIPHYEAMSWCNRTKVRHP